MRRNFAGTIIRIGGDTVQVRRRADGKYIQGKYVRSKSNDTEFEASGSMQVMSARELQLLPEAHRTKETRKFYTTTELKTGGTKKDKKEPDHVTYKNREYEVQSVGDWEEQANFFKYLLVKVGQ